MLSNYFILCHPLLLLPSIFPNIKVFSNESTLHINWPKYWSLSFSNCPWFPSGLTGLISMLSKESQESSPAPQFENINYLALNLLYSPTLTSAHNYGKNHSFPRQIFVGKVMSLLFNILSRIVIAFLSRSKCLLISWLQSQSAVILEPKKRKSVSASCFSVRHEVMGPDAMILAFLMLSFKPVFSLSFTFIKSLFSSFSLSAITVVSSAYLRLLIFLLIILVPACASSSLAFHIMYST